jgi:predicted amidohydrolase
MGIKIVAFGEAWLSGYPAWLDYCRDIALWNHPSVKEVFAKLRDNSVVVPGKETEVLSRVAREFKITVVIGVNEKIERGIGSGTLFNSLLFFDENGRMVNHHRKLIPTYTERIVWGNGDAHGLKAVDSQNVRIGGLICWEHWMPLARQALHNSGEHIHIAVWPSVHEMHQIASRHYAFEGRCFVLAAGLIMKAKDIPSELELIDELSSDPGKFILRGGSAIIAPDGRYIVEPVFDKEMILTAEIDIREIDKEKMTLDVTGHYARHDIFDFSLKDTGRPGWI